MKEVRKFIPKEMRRVFNKTMRRYFVKNLVAPFVFPLVWIRRRKYFEMGEYTKNMSLKDSSLYWFYDCDEYLHVKGVKTAELSFDNCTFGDDGFLERKGRFSGTPGKVKEASKLKHFFWAFEWLAIRNAWWNGKLFEGHNFTLNNATLYQGSLLQKYNIEKNPIINQPEGKSPLRWRNQKTFGTQVAIINFGDFVTFRASKTVPLHKWHPFRLFGRKYINKMRGANHDRFLYKNRFVK